MAVIVTSVDLRSRFGTSRDQGPRPTCLAFAASDAHSAARNMLTSLSTEYLYFTAQQRAKRPPDQGALLSCMLDALRDDGQPEEKGWPYLPTNPDPTTWSPPSTCGPMFKRYTRPTVSSVDSIITDLSANIPTVLCLNLPMAFFNPTGDGVVAAVTGDLPNPARRHAVVAIGHGTIDGERAILVRNSWGCRWGIEGNAWMTEAVLVRGCLETAKMLEEP